jgi:hypothetical protein
MIFNALEEIVMPGLHPYRSLALDTVSDRLTTATR